MRWRITHPTKKNTCMAAFPHSTYCQKESFQRFFANVAAHAQSVACTSLARRRYGRPEGAARASAINKKCGVQMSATQNRHWGTLGSTLRVVFGSPCVAVVPAEEMRCRMRINHACVECMWRYLFLDFVVHNMCGIYLYLGMGSCITLICNEISFLM